MNIILIMHVSRNRQFTGANAFIATMLFSSLWCISAGVELITINLNYKVFWSKVGYFSHAFGPLCWLIMVLELTDLGHVINKKRIFLMSIIPIITVILVWTNELHGLIWTNMYIDNEGNIHTLVASHGLWFWVHAVYSDFVNLFSVAGIIRFWRRKAPLYKKQLRYLAYSMLFVILINGLYVFRIGPKFDTTPIAWGISSVFITFGFFRNKLFDLVPIARSRIMEGMSEAIVVFDLKNRIVDINPVAVEVYHCNTKSIGICAEEFLRGWPELLKLTESNKELAEFNIVIKDEIKYYEASCLPVKNDGGNLLGKFITLRDVTEKKLTEQELIKKQKEIAVKEERDRMARDLHDNVGQIMGFINLQTQAIIEYMNKGEVQTAIRCLERLSEVAREEHNNVREFIITMKGQNAAKSKKLSELLKEINMQLNSLEKNYGITNELQYKVRDKFDFMDSKIIFQILNIIKETLNNIIKHSKASHVKLYFEECTEKLLITISDNGCGFDVKNVDSYSEKKYGIKFMKERSEEMGIIFEVNSKLGEGTSVKLQIPVEPGN